MNKFNKIAIKYSFLVSLLILFIMSVMGILVLNQTKSSFIKEMEIKAEFLLGREWVGQRKQNKEN